VARGQGAAIALTLDDPGAVEREVATLTGGAGADRVIEAVGRQEPLDLAGRLTRVRGRLVIAGYHQDGARQVDMQLWNWRGIDVINAHERDPAIALEGIRGAVAAVADGTLELEPLYTHRFELGRLDEALEAMRCRPDGFLKALVVP
jgi:threonine dehydrogenase-like Zn-dependent dehydrogenase